MAPLAHRTPRCISSCILALVLLGLASHCAIAQTTKEPPHVTQVPKGYHSTIKRIPDSAIQAWDIRMSRIPAKPPPDLPLDVRNVWLLLNQRLAESKSGFKVVLQTNMDPQSADAEFLARPIKSVFHEKGDEAALRKALATADCNGLLGVLIENTNLQALYREGCIILCNYIHA